MGVPEEGHVKLQLDVPRSLLQRIDAIAEQRARRVKPVPMMRWLMDTPEGRAFWSKHGLRTHLSQEEMNDLIKEEWTRCTGGSKKGRLMLMPHRLAVIEEALNAYLQPKDLAA